VEAYSIEEERVAYFHHKDDNNVMKVVEKNEKANGTPMT